MVTEPDLGDEIDGATDSDPLHVLHQLAAGPVHPVAFGRAGDLLDSVGRRRFLHSGPPIDARDSVGAMRGALIAALLLEKDVADADEAERLIRDGEIEFASCHDAGGVGALAGVVSPSVPILIVEHATGRRAFATVVEGLGRAFSFGNFDDETIEHVRWLGTEFSEIMNAVLGAGPTIDIISLQAKGLRRGDECHNRNSASTEGLVAMLAESFMAVGPAATPALVEIRSNPHFFLTLSMAAAKAVADEMFVNGPPGVVTAMAGNGVQAGLKVSGAVAPWYTAPAPLPAEMMLVPGTAATDAAPLMGDSGVTEAVGLGALSLTASPALARVLGVDVAGARAIVSEMRQITLTDHPRYLLADDDFRGSPFAISVDAVRATGITPALDAGYAHKIPGRGRVGANVQRLPLEIFDSVRI